jgi:hypothetical protein
VHVALAGLAIGLYLLLGRFIPPTFPHFGPFALLTVFGFLELVFDRWVWRILCFIPGLHVYNFAGTYEGNIWGEGERQFQATIIVKQTWSRIEIDFISGAASSKSFSASVIKDRLANGLVELIYNYFAPGTHQGEERVGAHYGTAMLRRVDCGKKLEGEYYTEQRRDSYGYIKVSRC